MSDQNGVQHGPARNISEGLERLEQATIEPKRTRDKPL